MENDYKNFSVKPYLKAGGYLFSCAVTLFIFLLGFKWTLLGLFWIPVSTPLIYVFMITAWVYYNYMWLRVALYLPSTTLLVARSYAALGVKLPWYKVFYLALCKANKIRKEDITLKRQGEYIKVLASTFTKPLVMLNFKRGESHEISKAIFIHTRHKVVAVHKAIIPYLVPLFIVVLILTPLFVFMPAYNYAFLAQKLSHTPQMLSFWMYLFLLPVKFIFVFKILSVLAVNIVWPLAVAPALPLMAAYVKENNVKVKFKKVNSVSFYSLMALTMIAVSLSFYISILANILL